MDIINKGGHYINKETALKCISLLGDEYLGLDVEIQIYKKINRLRFELKNNLGINQEYLDNVVESKVTGVFSDETNIIRIFPFNFRKDSKGGTSYSHIQFVYWVYHELRHAWQKVYMPEIFVNDRKIVNPTQQIEDYKQLPSEIDAYNFCLERVTYHHDELKKILGIPSHLVYKMSNNL